MRLLLIVLLSHCWSQQFVVSAVHSGVPKLAPTYVVDLDLPPIDRWNEVLTNINCDDVRNAWDGMMSLLVPSRALRELVRILADEIDRYIPQPFADELRGVSKALSINLGEIVLVNLVYDTTAYKHSGVKACTSIVALDKNNTIIHGRNLDYNIPDLLKPITIQAEFRKDGKKVFMATTCAGYIGVITGTRDGAFSISGDERDSGKWWENLLSALEKSSATFFLQRNVLEKAENYKSAINLLMNTPTISSVYYIVGGIRPGEGAIIVKNRWHGLNVTSMEKNWFIVETNYDPWKKPPASDDRRDAAIAAMNKVGKKNMDSTQLFEVLSSPLVFNNSTIYTTVMSASNPKIYKTWVRYDKPPVV